LPSRHTSTFRSKRRVARSAPQGPVRRVRMEPSWQKRYTTEAVISSFWGPATVRAWITLRQSCGDPSLFKLLFHQLSTNPTTERSNRQRSDNDDIQRPGVRRRAHCVNIGLFRAVFQHRAGPALRINKKHLIVVNA